MNENKFIPDDKQAEYEKKRDQAFETWHQNGRLGVTADDHWAIGGSPPIELTRNPGKTQGELWPVAKIAEALKGLADSLKQSRENLEKFKKDYVKSMNFRDGIIYAKKELRLAIPYLKSINKLPPEFEDFKVEDLPDDPKQGSD